MPKGSTVALALVRLACLPDEITFIVFSRDTGGEESHVPLKFYYY